MANVKIYKCLPHIFALDLTILEIQFKICYLQKVGQGHEVQFSQLYHLMANVKNYKFLPNIFAQGLTVSEI